MVYIKVVGFELDVLKIQKLFLQGDPLRANKPELYFLKKLPVYYSELSWTLNHPWNQEMQ